MCVYETGTTGSTTKAREQNGRLFHVLGLVTLLLLCYATRMAWSSQRDATVISISGTASEQTNPEQPDTLSVQDSSIQPEKPHLLLHFGPMKTGTSTLQSALHSELLPALKADGWHNAFRDEEEAYSTNKKTAEMVQQMIDALLRDYDTNVILSKEPAGILNRNPALYENLHNQLSTKFNVTLVVGYRPFNEWSPSLWYQHYTDFMDIKPKFHGVIGPWKDERTGEFILVDSPETTYWKYNSNETETETRIDDLRYAQTTLHAAERYGINTAILDLYSGVIETFCCDIMPNAHNTCEAAKTQEFKRKNSGIITHAYALAIGLQAGANGLVDIERYNRLQVWQAIHEHFDILGLPRMKCPEQPFFDDLTARTLRLDREIMSSMYKDKNNQREAQIRASIDKSIEKKSFCFVDMEALFTDQDWLAFLEQFSY